MTDPDILAQLLGEQPARGRRRHAAADRDLRDDPRTRAGRGGGARRGGGLGTARSGGAPRGAVARPTPGSASSPATCARPHASSSAPWASRATSAAVASAATRPARSVLPAVALRRMAHVEDAPFVAGEAVMIGDTPHDLRAARAHGMRCVLVATGQYSRAELAAAGPDVLLDDLSGRSARAAGDPGRGVRRPWRREASKSSWRRRT